jgi:hypothetical protein
MNNYEALLNRLQLILNFGASQKDTLEAIKALVTNLENEIRKDKVKA